jgi:hypothetical protein
MTQLQILSDRLANLYNRTPRIITDAQQKHANMQRLLVLASTSQENPLWQVILSYADEHARNELSAALAPALRDGDRQYNAGRAASAEDFATAIRDLRLAAERHAAKLKAE